MVLLDLSSAFDTVNHKIPFNTLASLGIQGQALEWFKSYISCLSQSVLVNGSTSSSKPLGCGVPQGAVSGPTLISIYLTGFRNILQRHAVHYHLYADDIKKNCFVSAESNSSFPSLAQFRQMYRRYRRLDEVKLFAVKPQ